MTIATARTAEQVAFPPDPVRARAVSDEIRSRLAASLREILDAARGIVEFDEDAVTRRIGEIERARHAAPSLYALYYEILFAMSAQEHDRAASLLRTLCTAPVGQAALAFRNLTDEDLGAGNAQRYSYWFDVDAEQPIDLAPVNESRFREARAAATGALALFDRTAPEVSGEIRELLTEVVFARSREGSRLIFEGASSFYLWGALMINAQEEHTPVQMAAALAHECAHSLLFGMAVDGPLVSNPDEERFRSPLRHDPRPIDGIYHATYVSARVHYALSKVVEHADVDEDERKEALLLSCEAVDDFHEGLEVVDEHARLTDLGRSILESARASMPPAR